MTLSEKCILLVAMLILPLAAAAQDVPDAPPPEEEDAPRGSIVVTGSNDPVTFDEVRGQARDIAVRQGNWLDTPLARFEDRLCPGVVGLDPNYAAMFNMRLRENAEYLDIRVLDDDCQANFVVIFAEDGESILRSLMDRNPEYFRYLDSGEQRDILEPGPVHVWTNIEPRTLTGMPIAQVRDLTSPPSMGIHGAHTRIYTTTRNDIVSIMITFDREAVSGMSIGQLADYATMRGLAQTQPPAEPTLDTILTLFNSDAPPLGLTDFDRAYLNSLYEGMPNLPAYRKLGGTVRELRDIVEGRDEEDEE